MIFRKQVYAIFWHNTKQGLDLWARGPMDSWTRKLNSTFRKSYTQQ